MGSTSYAYDLPGTVSAVFFTKQHAESAYQALLKMGHTEDDISILMSDETLNKHANPTNEKAGYGADEQIALEDEESKTGAKHLLADAIISITSMISLPELGISISRRLIGKVAEKPETKTISGVIATHIPEEHCDTYETGVREGGIIISVDPKNRAERDAIVREFRNNDGHDILGDDGYTELD
ncbi:MULTISPECIES: hypothetical protein [Dyadobacter]|uniref:Uncharacterized protein n=1 Tax=Dyadobacter chenhuakuii TaxID=2909339 RepID=A0A9X1U0J1_9BACT|nr:MULTISPECIES: hypothetical protein [Dyadobacter]MCE7070750.1 hypothetical protein [Dyadobacter sp. CY327]MCF2494336.1 hypothetical protein [Dyadobacter chenhuakuii]MCF2498311.1 hypothetical protein [Dyadobacter chenhuakuii]USJ31458.1 hypothetical protein NFI80_01700 [Dyadobacter chenhuakuii]